MQIISLRCLLDICRNEFGMTPDYGVASNSGVRLYAPEGLALQSLALTTQGLLLQRLIPQGLAQC